MKKLFLSLTIIAMITCSFVTLNFYTKDTVKRYAKKYTERACDFSHPYPTRVPYILTLSPLLYDNIDINVGANGSGGLNTPESYKNGWRKTVANHPEYIHSAVKLYGNYFITEYKSSVDNYYKKLLLEAKWKIRPQFKEDTSGWIHVPTGLHSSKYIFKSQATNEEKELALQWRKEQFENQLRWWRYDSTRIEEEVRTFSLRNYWEEQRKVFSIYHLLIKKMLLLDDNTLNTYVKSAKEPNNFNAMKPLFTWLYEQKIIPVQADSLIYCNEIRYQTWDSEIYPCDLIFLTHRICRDYPEQWTPRRFLMEADKFANEIEPLLPRQ